MLNGARPERRAPIYTTALVKCVPRESAAAARGPGRRSATTAIGFLSREISTITPHVLVPVGAQASAYVLARLLGDDAPAFDPLDLRVIRTPAFSVAPMPSPSEVSALPRRERKVCLAQLQALATRMRL